MEMYQSQLQELLQLLRFDPDAFQLITYYLPHLISGEPMPLVDPLIHRTDIYSCEPTDLAAQFDPVPQCGNTGDRFFFTPCKRLKGGGNRSQRTVGDGGGTWVSQHTKPIKDGAGVKVGEHKTLVYFTKDDEKTEWLMDEYRCCLQEAIIADRVMVMCKIHVSMSAAVDSEARQLSSAKLRGQQANRAPAPQPEAPVSTPATKRLAPVAADQPCPKKMRRTAVPSPAPPVVHLDRSPVFALAPPPPAYAPLPVSLPEDPAPAAAEGDNGNLDRFLWSLDELLGVCGEEDLPPADDKAELEGQQAAVLAIDDFVAIPTSDEFGDIFNDLPFLTLDDLDIPPAEPELHMPVFTSDESCIEAGNEFNGLLRRYEPRTIFTPDQLDGHNEFVSCA